MDEVQEGTRDRLTPWYVDSFGSDYLTLYSHRDDDEARSDVRGIIKMLSPRRDASLLDLACGAGRHLLALHRAGFCHLVGLDLSTQLLAAAARRLAAAGASHVQLIHGDMRSPPREQRFATILSLFTSFGYFPEDEENLQVLRGAYEALLPGGVLLVDTLNAPAAVAALVPSERRTHNGLDLRITRRYDAARRRLEKETRVVRDDGGPHTFRESVRVYDASELGDALIAAGFDDVECFGSLHGASYDEHSQRLVAVGRRAAE